MAFNIREFFKGLLISEENTNSPKQIEITPGGTSNTKTNILSSQTANRAITLPDDTTTLLGTATVQNVSNKTITTSTVDSTPIGQTVPAAVSTTSLVATTADINGGTIDATVIGATVKAAVSTTSLVADTADINAGTIDATVIGSAVPAAATVTSLVASTATISGGSINNTTVGATTPSTGSFTSLSASTATIGGASATTTSNTQTLTNKSLDDSTTRIVDTVDATKKLAFDVTGNINTTTTIRSSQTLDRTLDLPDATDTLVARNTTDTLTNKTLTTPIITTPAISGGSINNTTIGATTPSTAAFTTLTTTGNATIGGNTIITGNLTVNGTETILNTQTLDVEDTNITVNINGNDASSEGAGLTVDRTGTSGSLIYKDTSATKFAAGALGAEVDLVGTSSTQGLSNKTITASSLDSSPVGASTPSTGSFTTLAATTATVGGAAVTTETNTQTLTNKTLQFLQEAVATDAATTGTATTLAAFTTGIVRLTNASLVSLAGIPAGASGQNLTIENKTGAAISILDEDLGATAANRIQTGTAATISLANNASLLLKYDTTSSRYQVIGGTGSGSGSGSGGVNFIPAGDAETTNPFIGYQYFSTTRPTAAGSPAVTGVAASISATAPLAGNNSFLITKTSGANAQGLAVDIPFTVSPAYRAKVNTIEFDYMLVSGTFQVGSLTQDSDLIVYIGDVDNNVAIEPSNFKFLSNSTTNSEKFSAQFQTSFNSENYRLTFYTATTNTPNYSMKVDNIKVGPSEYVYGTPITDTVTTTTMITSTGTSPTKGTIVNDIFTYARHGDKYLVTVDYLQSTGGTDGTGNYLINLPFSIDLVTHPINSVLSLMEFVATPTVNYHGAGGLLVHSATQLRVPSIFYNDSTGAQGSNTNFAAGTVFSFNDANLAFTAQFQVKAAGLSSSVQMSDNTDTRVVQANASIAPSAAITAATTINFATVINDTHGGFSAGTYRVSVSGFYQFTLTIDQNNASNYEIFKNGINQGFIGYNVANNFGGGSRNIELLVGDLITIRPVVSGVIQATSYLSVTRISGPSAIASNEINGATAQGTGQTFTSGVLTTIIATTVISNTHGSYNNSTGTFTCNRAGYLDVGGGIGYIGTGSGSTSNTASIYKNGVLVLSNSNAVPAAAQQTGASVTALLIPVISGDLITVGVTVNGFIATANSGYLTFAYR